MARGRWCCCQARPGSASRGIVKALRERLATQAYTALSHYCSPHHTATALHPVIGLLERAAGFIHDDSPEARLEKLEALLAQGTERLAEAVPLIADVLGIAAGKRYPMPGLSPQRKAQRTLGVLVEQVEGLATRQPVLALYEDVHWIDPTTLELLGLLVDQMPTARLLTLLTCRPTFQSPWERRSYVSQVTLSRLAPPQVERIAEQVAGGKPLPAEILRQLVAKADGVPLFVEEMTKSVLESGALALVRAPGEPAFDDAVVTRLRTLGDLASIALQKLLALAAKRNIEGPARRLLQALDG